MSDIEVDWDSKCRKEFEEAFADIDEISSVYPNGRYADIFVQWRWEGFQAAWNLRTLSVDKIYKLKEYDQHDDDCGININGYERCSCGFHELIDEIEANK
jgi:hypothetical protein